MSILSSRPMGSELVKQDYLSESVHTMNEGDEKYVENGHLKKKIIFSLLHTNVKNIIGEGLEIFFKT